VSFYFKGRRHQDDIKGRRYGSAQHRINIEGRTWNSPARKRKNEVYTNNVEDRFKVLSVELSLFISSSAIIVIIGIVPMKPTEIQL